MGDARGDRDLDCDADQWLCAGQDFTDGGGGDAGGAQLLDQGGGVRRAHGDQ